MREGRGRDGGEREERVEEGKGGDEDSEKKKGRIRVCKQKGSRDTVTRNYPCAPKS